MEYDFEGFVQGLIGLGGFEALSRADRESERVERAAKRLFASRAAREAAAEYRWKLGALKMYLVDRKRPQSLEPHEFDALRPLAEDFVERGIFDASALRAFD